MLSLDIALSRPQVAIRGTAIIGISPVASFFFFYPLSLLLGCFWPMAIDFQQTPGHNEALSAKISYVK